MSFRNDHMRLGDHGRVSAAMRSGDTFGWKCHTTVEKFHVPDYHAGRGPHDVLEVPGNLLLYGGADILFLGLKGSLSGTSGLKNTYYNNANAALLFGDSTAAVAVTQTDLQASSGGTHRWVQGMDATFPTHTSGSSASTHSKILYKCTLTSANGNFTNGIREWGVGNKVSQAKAYPGRLLNRKVQNLGTKTTLGIWAVTITLSES